MIFRHHRKLATFEGNIETWTSFQNYRNTDSYFSTLGHPTFVFLLYDGCWKISKFYSFTIFNFPQKNTGDFNLIISLHTSRHISNSFENDLLRYTRFHQINGPYHTYNFNLSPLSRQTLSKQLFQLWHYCNTEFLMSQSLKCHRYMLLSSSYNRWVPGWQPLSNMTIMLWYGLIIVIHTFHGMLMARSFHGDHGHYYNAVLTLIFQPTSWNTTQIVVRYF